MEPEDQAALGIDAEEQGRVHAGDVPGDEVVLGLPRRLRAVPQLAADLVGGPVAGAQARHPERVDHQAHPLPRRVLEADVDRDPRRVAGVQDRPAAEADGVQQELVDVPAAGDAVDARHPAIGEQPAAFRAAARWRGETCHEISLPATRPEPGQVLPAGRVAAATPTSASWPLCSARETSPGTARPAAHPTPPSFSPPSYPVSWAINAVRPLASDLTIPGWLSAAVHFGVPGQTGAALISERGLSGAGALQLAAQLPPRWADARPALDDITAAAARESGLTRADAARLAAGSWSAPAARRRRPAGLKGQVSCRSTAKGWRSISYRSENVPRHACPWLAVTAVPNAGAASR